MSRIKTAPALNSLTTTREEHNWWCENGGGYVAGGNESEKDKGVAVASELAALASYMAGYLKGAGATCAPSGSPQYHTHHGHHPAMSVGTHHHAHSHSHPGGPHPSLSSPFALATHGHPHGHPLDHGLGGFPQGKFFMNKFLIYIYLEKYLICFFDLLSLLYIFHYYFI